MKIPGLSLHVNFVDDSVSDDIIKDLNKNPWESKPNGNSRQLQHYGDTIPTPDPNPCTNYKIPSSLVDLMSTMPEKFNQITVNKYTKRSFMPFHIDCHDNFENCIAILSLCDSGEIGFERDSIRHTLTLPKNSLLIMKDEARYAWFHGVVGTSTMPPRIGRISLAFRTKRTTPCTCKWKETCPSQGGKLRVLHSRQSDAVTMYRPLSKNNKLETVCGDLLTSKEDYIIQQCNCISVKPHGLSKYIAEKRGCDPYSIRRCVGNKNLAVEKDRAIPGTIYVKDSVICLFAQYGMGQPYMYNNKNKQWRDGYQNRLQWFTEALEKIPLLEPTPKSLGVPFKIGCGLAGGNWKQYKKILEEFSDKFGIAIKIYKQ